MKKKKYNYFEIDKYTYDCMQDETLKEMNRVKNKKHDPQRTIVQIEISGSLFKRIKPYGFEIQSIDWDNRNENYKDVILDSYDFIVSEPKSAGLSNLCKNVVLNKQLEETISNYLENSPKNKIRYEVSSPHCNKISVYLSLPTLLAYKLKFSSLMSGGYMSDIIMHILGYLMPKLIVQRYGKYLKNKRYIVTEDGHKVGINYRVINKMWVEILRFSNDKVRNALNLSLFDTTDEYFVNDFESFINLLITDYSPYYSVFDC